MPLTEPVRSLRHYDGQAHVHMHDYAQIMVPLAGRMELEINGHALFTDPSCGMVIPAGARHAYQAQPGTRILVIDTPESAGMERLRRFAITPACRALGTQNDTGRQLTLLLGLPTVQASRRGLDLTRLDSVLTQTLHESWTTSRMAELFHLSPQRFHIRLHELTGSTPGDYLRALRLKHAATLLARGVSLEITAARVGYRSASALAYALRRDQGTSARALRQSFH